MAMTTGKLHATYSITTLILEDVPSDGVTDVHPWVAIASTQVYDPSPVKGLTGPQAHIAGAVLRTVEGRGSAKSEAEAVWAAIQGLMFQRKHRGS